MIESMVGSLNWLAKFIIPGLLVGIPLYAMAAKKVKVYEVFVVGAKDGFTIAVRIIPYLVAILVAIGMFRASGALDYLIDEIDLILVMSVNPGFGGQSFIHSQLDKIAKIRAMIDASGRSIHLEVDGGVNAETARLCVEAGADVLVAGSATFKGGPDCYADNIAALKGDGA